MTGEFATGDTVLLRGPKGEHLVTIDGGMFMLSNPRGALDTGRLAGMRPGDVLRMGSLKFRVFRPDVLDLILNLDRGPQMILPKDSSRIVMELGLSAGCSVVEGGAGSGALSIALLNAVAPSGRVITYDIRQDHLEKAGSNIRRSSLSSIWEGKLGDISEKIEEREMDAFAVDVPEPEKAVNTAATSLRAGGRFCSYVPTTNQMERVVLALRDEGFDNARAIEIIERGYSVKGGATRPVTEMLSHTGFLVFARWPGSSEPGFDE
jgi:tRNA (adenine57-N1/adenine58-N1)-methyltransferase